MTRPHSAANKWGSHARVILLSGVITLALCPVLAWVYPPIPYVRDEFSYLLAADTFAHGRLTNPTHPLWVFFEAAHINQQPTYQSRYPPGQGLFLAAGQVLTGYPIAGVWLGMALASAATCWMLLAWAPPRWALFGALLPATRFGTFPFWEDPYFAYWAKSFWGGGVAMIGGALLFGAMARLARKPCGRDAVLLAAGLVVLANTRPYEGLVAAVAAGLALLAWEGWRSLVRLSVPVLLVLVPCIAAMGYYNWRGTGEPLKMPYTAHADQYEIIPVFLFQPLRYDKTYHHASIRSYQEGAVRNEYTPKQQGLGLTWEYLSLPLRFFWGPILFLAAAVALLPPWDRRAWFAAGVLVLAWLASAITVAGVLRPHYLGPVAPMFVYLAVAGLRRMRVLRWSGRRLGRPVAEAAVAFCLLSFALAAVPRYVRGAITPTPLAIHRPQVIKRLESLGGQHLVVVRYGSTQSQEWVYNGADIDSQPIVWARDMGEQNARLFDYYHGRTAWLLWAEEDPPRLEPYTRFQSPF